MFGVIKPCKECSAQSLLEYKKYYCGLCAGMGRNFGDLSRIFVNYDLSSIYMLFESTKGEGIEKIARCPLNPFRKVAYIDEPILLDMISMINFIMVYFKCQDDVQDDGSFLSSIMVKLLTPQFNRVCLENDILTTRIKENLEKITETELISQKVLIKDVASLFGTLLSDSLSLCSKDEEESEVFNEFTYWLGIWIYLMDACLDFHEDYKTKNYNPVFAGIEKSEADIIKDRMPEIRNLVIECQEAFDQLLTLMNVKKNQNILRDLFSGNTPNKVAKMLLGETS